MQRVIALIEKATDPEEVSYLENVIAHMKEPPGFTFIEDWLLSVHKMACGHYEIFQHPHRESLEYTAKDAKTRKCTRCICNWPRKEAI